jgi:hypothetical protein
MVAVADQEQEAEPIMADTTTSPMLRRIGFAPSASMIAGAAIAAVWLWVPIMIAIFGISAIPSVIGFAVAVVVFVYLMRGAEWLERV